MCISTSWYDSAQICTVKMNGTNNSGYLTLLYNSIAFSAQICPFCVPWSTIMYHAVQCVWREEVNNIILSVQDYIQSTYQLHTCL